MDKITFKKIEVDGETRVAMFINEKFADEVDLHSGFSVRDAKESLRDGYNKGYYNHLKNN